MDPHHHLTYRRLGLEELVRYPGSQRFDQAVALLRDLVANQAIHPGIVDGTGQQILSGEIEVELYIDREAGTEPSLLLEHPMMAVEIEPLEYDLIHRSPPRL